MKKGLIIASIASVMAVAGGLSFVVANANKGIRFEAAKAADKSFTFNQSTGSQFDNGGAVSTSSVITGVSDKLETSVSLLNGSTEEIKTFGDNGYFVRNGSTISHARYVISIGVNNPTSVSVTYGLAKPELNPSTNVNEIRCWIGAYANDVRLDETATSGDSGIGEDAYTYTWTKQPEQTTPADEIRIEVNTVDGSNIYWGEPLYIKSIVLNWSC